MRQVKLNIRLVTFLAAVVVAVVAVGSLAPAPRQAYADFPDPTGVFCADLTDLGGIVLARFDYNFDPVDGNPNDVAISLVAYVPDGGASCQVPQSELVGVTFATESTDRPTLTGKWNATTNTMTAESCAEEFELGGIVLPGWTKIILDLTIEKIGKTVDADTFTLRTAQVADTCGDTGGTAVIAVAAAGEYLDGPGGDPATFTSDWDKDGCTDWAELDPDPLATRGADPFNPADCPVGGIAELPAVAGTPLEAAGSSGTNVGLIAAYAAAAAAGALALGSVAWYARRRSVR